MKAKVRAAIDRCERASLVFDLAAIEANMKRVAGAARTHGIKPLFACKSFPHPDVRALAATILDGFDVASLGELRDAPSASILSIVDPSGGAIGHAPVKAHRVIVGCETVEQVHATPDHCEIAIRVSASITGRDPAVGAVLDGSGHRRSRFGVEDRAAVAALVRAAGHARIGVHVHHGPITPTSSERFIATALAAIELLDHAPAFVDLGGAWHGIVDLESAFAEVRAAIPREIEIIVEPGRTYAEGTGFATGRVTSMRELSDRLLVTGQLSRISHLRWSQVDLVAKAPRPGEGKHVLVLGPTCYEEDMIGEYVVEREAVSERIVVKNVSGYAVAWNTSFGGVPAADVLMIR